MNHCKIISNPSAIPVKIVSIYLAWRCTTLKALSIPCLTPSQNRLKSEIYRDFDRTFSLRDLRLIWRRLFRLSATFATTINDRSIMQKCVCAITLMVTTATERNMVITNPNNNNGHNIRPTSFISSVDGIESHTFANQLHLVVGHGLPNGALWNYCNAGHAKQLLTFLACHTYGSFLTCCSSIIR